LKIWKLSIFDFRIDRIVTYELELQLQFTLKNVDELELEFKNINKK